MTSHLRRFLVACLAVVLSGCLHVGAPGPAATYRPVFTPSAAGDWQVVGTGYTATIAKAGYLTSFKVGAVETVGAPFVFQPDAKLVADRIEAVGGTLKVHLAGTAGAEATIDYQFRRDGVTIIPTWKGKGYARFQFTAAPGLLGIELLNDKSVSIGGDSTRFVERGEIRGVPAVGSARNQMVRFHFPGFGLHAYVQAWGAPFNYESAGNIAGFTWGRGLMAAGQAFPLVFTIDSRRDQAVLPALPALPALPFVPRADQPASLYYADEPCTWTLDCGESAKLDYLRQAGINELAVAWQLTDFHDKVVETGRVQLSLVPGTDGKVTQAVRLTPPGPGYYQVRFTLTDATGRMLPSSFLTRFTVINRVPGMITRDEAMSGKNPSDYAVVAMIGIGGIRESHNIGGFFSDREQAGPAWVKVEGATPPVWMNAKAIDELFNFAAAEGAKFRLTWFFQANGRPAYATPAVYEAMAYALVSRCKDRCRTWEVENEPNFGYTPENYVNQCVIPFAKGAKRADPGCVVMGPGGCGVRDTLRFMEKIYAMGANRWFDQISTHSYPGPGEPWERFGNLSMLAELRAWMKEHGDGGKALWQTEQGYTWDAPPKGQAARFAVRQFLQAWRLGIEPQRHYYFYPQSHGFESWYQAGGGEAGSERSWLPIAAAQRFLAENTFGRTYAGDIPSPYKGIYLARFTGGEDDVIAAWTFDFETVLQVRTPQLRQVAGFMGNRITLARRPAASTEPPVYDLPISGEPVYIHLVRGAAFDVVTPAFGRNLAGVEAGAEASASSADPKNPPAFAIDGNWELWEDAPGLTARTSWVSGQKHPSLASPDTLEVRFPCPRVINRLLALCYLPAVNPSPRDFRFEALVGGRWRTVGEGKDEWNWLIHREFPPVTATAVRFVVTRINDGWHGDGRWMHVLMGPKATSYTACKLLVSEFEAYGPGPAPRLALRTAGGINALTPGSKHVITVAVAKRDTGSGILKARIQVPAGCTVDADTLTFDLAKGGAGGEIATAFALSAAPELAPGPVPVRVRLEDSTGAALDAVQLTLNVTSPFRFQPQAPEIRADGVRLTLAVTNLAAAPLTGTARCELRRRDAPAGTAAAFQQELAFGPLAPQATEPVAFTAGGVKLAGTSWTLTLTVTANGIREISEQPIDIRGWQVLGPFPNAGGSGFDTAYAPETRVEVKKACAIPGVKEPVRWQTVPNSADGLVDLHSALRPNSDVCAYGVIYVKSAAAQKAMLSAGSDDGIKLWLNGALVASNNAQRGAAPGQEQVAVTLKAGWNEVLLKITQGGGGWGFYFDLLTPDGSKPLPGLVYAPGRE